MTHSEVVREAVGIAEELVDHGYCPNCGCDLWNTQGCPTCPTMRRAYDLLVSLCLRERRRYAIYAEADDINKRNMQG